MKKIYIFHLVITLLMNQANLNAHTIKTPRLTVVIIIDQFAYSHITKLKNHFQFGIKKLLDKGVVFDNAYHPHGVPETTTGHHALSTGTLPNVHGGAVNEWFDETYKKINFADDNTPNAEILGDSSHTETGKSSINTMVDGLSDQFAFRNRPNKKRMVISLSLKSHPTVATANKQGKAIWLDSKSGKFTSSKRYYKELPEWVSTFNATTGPAHLESVKWETMHEQNSSAYDFPFAKNYDYAGYNFSLISLPAISIDRTQKNPYDLYTKTPHASKILMELAKTCIEKNLTQKTDHMLMWLCVSTLDLIGHIYGPDSMEAIDTLYHIDQQLKDFLNFAKKHVGSKECLFVLTGDHGVAPIPEIAQKQGFLHARRIMVEPLIATINANIEKKYHLKEIIKGFDATFFTLNKEALKMLDKETKKSLILDVKKILQNQEGIKSVWTTTELINTTFKPTQLENFYKNQIFKGRCGDIICMPEQYCLITNYPTGTTHASPYEYDTHVPLIMYQKSYLEKKQIHEKVWTPQLPVTLAHILNVARPSASTYDLLPGVIQ